MGLSPLDKSVSIYLRRKIILVNYRFVSFGLLLHKKFCLGCLGLSGVVEKKKESEKHRHQLWRGRRFSLYWCGSTTPTTPTTPTKLFVPLILKKTIIIINSYLKRQANIALRARSLHHTINYYIIAETIFNGSNLASFLYKSSVF